MSAKEYLFDGSRKVCLKDMPTTAGDRKKDKAELVEKTAKNIARAAELQEKLYAAGEEGLIIALQARDAAGKDSQDFKDFCSLLFDQALLLDGMIPEDPAALAQQIARMMAK